MWKDFAYFVSFRPFSLLPYLHGSPKKCKRVLGCKISNLKISIRGRGQSSFEMVGAIIHSIMYHLFFIIYYLLLLFIIYYTFLYFLRMKIVCCQEIMNFHKMPALYCS